MAPVRAGHGLAAGPARPLAGVALGSRSTAGALRLPQLGPAGGGLRGGRGVRGARLAHHPAAGRPRRRGRGAARARLRVQALPRCVRRPARAAGAHRARSRRGPPTGAARCASSPQRWSRSCWSTCRSRSRATRAGGRRSPSRSCGRSTSPRTRSGTGASGRGRSPTNLEFQATVDRLSPVLVLASFTVALAVGWRRWRRDGSLPVDRGQRRDAVRVPAAAQGALAAVHPVAPAVLRPAAGALGLGRRLPGGGPRDVRRHLPAVLPAQRRPGRRHRGRVRRPGRRDRGVGPGGPPGGTVRRGVAGADRTRRGSARCPLPRCGRAERGQAGVGVLARRRRGRPLRVVIIRRVSCHSTDRVRRGP